MFLAAATSLALASCSNDHDVELNHGSEICFRTAFDMPHHGSRAAEYNNNTGVGDIVVTATCDGEVYFKDVVFNYIAGVDGQPGTYSSDPVKYYWPGDNRTLTFTAIKQGQTDFIGKTFAPVADWANQEDLVYSVGATGSLKASTNGVNLDFNHALSQIEIKALNNNDQYVIEVVNAKIAHVNNQAEFTLGANAAASAWSNATGDASYTTTDYTAIPLTGNAVSVMGNKGNAMVLPQQLTGWNGKTFGGTNPQGSGSYLALKVRIKTVAGAFVYPTKEMATAPETQHAWVAVPINTLWEKGKKYTYTLVFGDGAGYTDPENPTPGPGPNPKDPYPVLDGQIKVVVNTTDWTAGEVSVPGTTTPAAARRK